MATFSRSRLFGAVYATGPQRFIQITPGEFTADAIIKRTIAASFTLDAVIVPWFTADAVIKRTQAASFTIDAFVARGFLADAIIKKTVVNARETVTVEGSGHHTFRTALSHANLLAGTYEGFANGQQSLAVGQKFVDGTPDLYYNYEAFLSFPTGTLPDSATVEAAILRLFGFANHSEVDFVVEAFDYDWTGTSEHLDQSDVAALTVRATFSTSGFATGSTPNDFTDVDLPAVIATDGDTELILVSQEYRTGSAPSTSAGSDEEWVEFDDEFLGGSTDDPKLIITYLVGTPFTLDAVIVPWFTADAVIFRTQLASFTADAVISAGAGTVQAGFTADAVIRVTGQTATFTADALIRRAASATFTADAVIKRAQAASFTANAVIKVTGQTASFTIGAWIYAPRQDPEGPGEPGETPLVSILVAGEDVTQDVVLSDATFTMLVNGAIGTFHFRVRDDDHVRNFVSGAEVTLDIDGKRKFGGYLMQPKRLFAFPVEDTTDPERPSRFITLEGVDYNILLQKRVVYDHGTPANVELRSWPAGSHDDVVIRYVFDNYTDLAADGVRTYGVTHVGSPNPDKTGVIGSGGLRFVDTLREINRLISGVFYIDPFKDLNFVDVDTPDAFFGMSDRPETGEVGYRELEQVENGTGLVNDAMVWGAGQGSDRIAFSRVQDTASIAAHRRWQFGEFTTALFRQASVDMRADSIVNGSPQSKRGGKDDQESWKVISYEKSWTVGQKVEIESEVFGKADVVPIRRMTVTFPTKKSPKFEMVLSHEIDEPWNLFEFWFPKFGGFPGFGWDDGPGFQPSECNTPVSGGCANAVITMSDRFLTSGALDGTVTNCGSYVSYEGTASDGDRLVFADGLGDLGMIPNRASDLPQCLLTAFDMTNVNPGAILKVGRASAKDVATPDVDDIRIAWHDPLDGLATVVVIKSDSQATYNNVAIPDKFFIRQEWSGDTHNAKVWAWDETEPSGWDFTHTDATEQPLALYAAMTYDASDFGAADVYCYGFVFSSGSGTYDVPPTYNDDENEAEGRAWTMQDIYDPDSRNTFRNGSVLNFDAANFDFRMGWDTWTSPPEEGYIENFEQTLLAIPVHVPDRTDDLGFWRGQMHLEGSVRIARSVGPSGEVVMPGIHMLRIRLYSDYGTSTPTWPAMSEASSLLPSDETNAVVWEGEYDGGDGTSDVLLPVDFTLRAGSVPCPDYVILGISIEDITSQELITEIGPWGGPIVGGPDREYITDLRIDTVTFDYDAPTLCGQIALCGGDGSFKPPFQIEGSAGEEADRLSSTLYQLTNAFHLGSTRVFKNGFFQRPNIEYTESPLLGQITFAAPVDIADTIYVFYMSSGSPD